MSWGSDYPEQKENDLWTPAKQRESAIPLSPIMQQMDDLRRRVERLEAFVKMGDFREEGAE
jgi:hypothetical protein